MDDSTGDARHRFGDPESAADADSGIYGFSVPPEEAAAILIPVPFDATTSYRGGASNGPDAILRASRQIDFYDPEIGPAWGSGITLLDTNPDIRAWSDEAGTKTTQARALADGAERSRLAADVDAICERLNALVRAEVGRWIERGKLVGTVGGDHATAFGAIAAHAAAYPDLGILQIDAHADLRRGYEGFRWSHAAVMHNVLESTDVARLVQVGLRDLAASEAERIRDSDRRIVAFYDHDLAGAALECRPFSSLVARIVDALPEQVYVSFDIDGLDPALCPHTGTPVPGGLSFHQASALLAGVTRSGRRIVGFDLTEVAPDPDGDDWDGNVAARILYKLCGHGLSGRT